MSKKKVDVVVLRATGESRDGRLYQQGEIMPMPAHALEQYVEAGRVREATEEDYQLRRENKPLPLKAPKAAPAKPATPPAPQK